MNMSADKDSSDDEYMEAIAKFDKQVEESMKKLRSAEKIDPSVPNPYEKGSEDWWKYHEGAKQSLQNIERKQRKKREEHGFISVRDDPRFAGRVEKFKSEYAARRAVARAKLANTNNNNKTTNDADMEKKTFDNDIAK